jgi:hypothetical protein
MVAETGGAYILPIKVDVDAELPGIPDTIG